MQPNAEGTSAGGFDPAFEELRSLVVDTLGHVRLSAKSDWLMEKISRRLGSHGLSTVGSYLELVRRGVEGKAELDCLIAELTVGETSFFRHQEQFDALRDRVLPACLNRNNTSRQLRIWSAGCANGAEPYSIAILVHSLLGGAIADWHVVIVGSDINRTFLAEAERGVYSNWTLRDMPEEQKPAFFARDGGNWAIKDKYKSNVQLVYHNLVSDEFPCIHKNIFAFDVIMCRNVMIYLEPAKNRTLADRLASVLVDDGCLFTGPTDLNPRLDEILALERIAGSLLYRRRPPGVRIVAAEPPTVPVNGRAHQANGAVSKVAPTRAARAARRPQKSQQAIAPTPSIDTIVALANRGDWTAAERDCRMFLEAEPFNAAAHYYHALIQHYAGSTAEAERALRRAIYLDRNFALAHYQLGLMHKDAHELSRCRRSFRNALNALSEQPTDRPVSPCGQITAADLRDLATQQLALLGPV